MTIDEDTLERALHGKAGNRAEHIEYIKKLVERAQPNNQAWQILVNVYGFQPDYTEADEGMWQE